MTATEREALERINARQNAANLFTNITPADIAREVETMNEEQKEEVTPMSITPAEKIQACNIIIRQGGYRERDLLTRPHEITRGETWNEEHKVVNVLETTPDPDGYRAGCAVDIVTRAIVG